MLTLQTGTATRNCAGVTRRAAAQGRFSRCDRAHAARVSACESLAAIGRERREIGHPHLARRRAEPTRNLRPQAGSPGRVSRSVRRLRRPRSPASIVSALMPEVAKRMRQDGARALAAPRQRRPLRRGALDADRPLRFDERQPAAEVPVGRFVRRSREGHEQARPARVRRAAVGRDVYLFPGYMGAAYLGRAVQPVRRGSRPEVPRRSGHDAHPLAEVALEPRGARRRPSRTPSARLRS